MHKYRVLSKGNENSVVMTTEPASERGQILLMKGRDLWIFMPDVSQPSTSITVAAANRSSSKWRLGACKFYRDYNATILRTEAIDGENY